MTPPPWTAAEFRAAMAHANGAERDIGDDPDDDESDTDLAPPEPVEVGEPVGRAE